MSAVVRVFRPDDGPAVRAILAATLNLGGRLPFPIADFDRLVAFFLDGYLVREPESCFVLVGDDDAPVGYLVGTVRPDEYDRWRRGAALRLGLHWARRWRRYDALTRWFIGLRLRDARQVIGEEPAPLESHYHWSLLPAVRGPHWRALLAAFEAHAAAAGRAWAGGEMNVRDDRRDGAPFARVGFEVLARQPNHTLSAVRGEPIWRLTVRRRTVRG